MMKGLTFIILVFAFSFPQSASAAMDMVYVQRSTVNIREGAGNEYGVVAIAKNGDKLKIIGSQRDWLRVQLENKKEGWIWKGLVSHEIPEFILVKELRSRVRELEKENKALIEHNKSLKDSEAALHFENERLKDELHQTRKQNVSFRIWGAVIRIFLVLIVLLTGWGLGYATGFFRRESKQKSLRSRRKAIDRELRNLIKEKNILEMGGTFSDKDLKEKEALIIEYSRKIKNLQTQREKLQSLIEAKSE